jgi:antitoxin component YwqK of YwqJK toxin-antitoxin module
VIENYIYSYETTYHKNGNLKCKYRTKFGVKDGEYIKYYKNGQIKKIIYYTDNKLNGPYKKWAHTEYFYVNGQSSSELEYEELSNEEKSISNSHLLEIETNYVNGKLDGEYKEWWIINEGEYSGPLASQSFYKKGVRQGEYKTWFESGQLYVDTNYKDNVYHGEYKSYYEDGMKYIEASYINGKLEGEYKEWHENGQLQKLVYYKKGKKNGEFKVWHETGHQYVIMKFKNNIIIDVFKKWDKFGRLIFEKYYTRYKRDISGTCDSREAG